MCCEPQLILPVSACRWPAMRRRRLASLSGGQSGKLNTVSVSGVNNKTPAGCGRFQSLEGSRGFFFSSLIKTNRRTQQLVNNDEWLPESRPLPPPPPRFQSSDQQPRPKWEENRAARLSIYWPRLLTNAAGLPPPRLLSRDFTLNLPSTSRPARPEPVVQITPQINNVPNSFGIISGSFHLLSPLGGDRRGEAASTRRPHIQLRQ